MKITITYDPTKVLDQLKIIYDEVDKLRDLINTMPHTIKEEKENKS